MLLLLEERDCPGGEGGGVSKWWACASWSLVPAVMRSLELLGCAFRICALPAWGGGISGSTEMGEGKGGQGDGGLKRRYSFCI